MKYFSKRTHSIILAVISVIFIGVVVSEENRFDHSTTAFPLTGQHSVLSCESCHIRGIFKGLPTTCEGCHDKFAQIGGQLKPVTHVRTSAPCDDCHTDNSWSAVRMDHSDITQQCISCHNGSLNTGKPIGHVVSSDNCDDCHLTISWIPARFDHFGITDNCVTCHNGTIAQGKHLAHVPSNDVCDDCHSTAAWIPAQYDHSGITDACFSCHDGSYATPKHATHYATVDTCEDCHLTTAWSPALFDHAGVSGDCDSCHNNSNATGIGPGHLDTTKQCDTCHYVTGWGAVKSYLHDSPNYPGEHTGVTLGCYSCHRERTVSLGWVASGYYPDCAACHVNDYDNGSHEGLTVNDIPDCSGTCHKSIPQHQLFHSDWGL